MKTCTLKGEILVVLELI